MPEIIKSVEEINNCKENRIILKDSESFKMSGTEIKFSGTGNILYCEENVNLKNSRLNFDASNSVIYLSSGKHAYMLNVHVYNNCTCYIGKNGYYNGVLHAICSEEKAVFIGDEAMMSFGVWLRTADPHLIYSAKTNERLNMTRSIFIGDHVWIGQHALVFKGSKIHSGSILGGGAVLAGGRIPSNNAYAGNPARKITEDIFWDPRNVHKWTSEDAEKYRVHQGKRYVFTEDEDSIAFETIDNELSSKKTPEEKIDYLIGLSNNSSMNRFAHNG